MPTIAFATVPRPARFVISLTPPNGPTRCPASPRRSIQSRSVPARLYRIYLPDSRRLDYHRVCTSHVPCVDGFAPVDACPPAERVLLSATSIRCWIDGLAMSVSHGFTTNPGDFDTRQRPVTSYNRCSRIVGVWLIEPRKPSAFAERAGHSEQVRYSCSACRPRLFVSDRSV